MESCCAALGATLPFATPASSADTTPLAADTTGVVGRVVVVGAEVVVVVEDVVVEDVVVEDVVAEDVVVDRSCLDPADLGPEKTPPSVRPTSRLITTIPGETAATLCRKARQVCRLPVPSTTGVTRVASGTVAVGSRRCVSFAVGRRCVSLAVG